MSLSLLTPASQAVADTVIALAARDALSTAVDVAVVFMAVGVGVLTFLFALVLRRVDRRVREVRRTLTQNLGPVSDRARSISDNVEFITEALRTDVRRLNESIKALSGRLNQASDRMEERIEEFNALMELVQSEAEDIFIDTAATVRGVREGARTIASGEGVRLREEDAGLPGRTPGPEARDGTAAGAPGEPLGAPPAGAGEDAEAPGNSRGVGEPETPGSSPAGNR